MTLLALDRLSVRLAGREVVREVSLRVDAGELVGLVGPNGAGKTSLMRAALGLIPATGGSSLARLAPPERARAAAWLPQSREIAWPVSVETLVALGRLPLRAGATASPADRAAVEAAMEHAGVAQLRTRPATELSGGEQARVLIARALAQEAPLTLADEPTAGLDPAHQIAAMESFAALVSEGRGAIVSLHDLGLAARWCTRLVMLHEGQVVAEGAPEAVLTLDRLRAIYGVEAHLAHLSEGLVVQALRRCRPE
ncbi:MAG TPA: ABC transporter ATP-binding protein [Paracoccaceae bacterium]|nr:ABC transporter ATP-binding protein [Paracoccaceae bacterium]